MHPQEPAPRGQLGLAQEHRARRIGRACAPPAVVVAPTMVSAVGNDPGEPAAQLVQEGRVDAVGHGRLLVADREPGALEQRRARCARSSTPITGSSVPCPIATGRPARPARSSSKPATIGDEAGERDDPGRPRPPGAEAERVGHHRPLREARDNDPVGRRRRARRRSRRATRRGRRRSAGTWPGRAGRPRGRRTSGRRRAAAAAARAAAPPPAAAPGSSASASGKRSCSSAPRPWISTSRPSGAAGCGPGDRRDRRRRSVLALPEVDRLDPPDHARRRPENTLPERG